MQVFLTPFIRRGANCNATQARKLDVNVVFGDEKIGVEHDFTN
jgi:hypothetical protein